MKQDNGLCLILGAGFSAPFGIPVTSELWEVCMRTAPGATEPTLIEAKEHYPLKSFIERKIKDIELLLTVWLAHDAALETVKGAPFGLFVPWKENRLRLLDFLENLQAWLHHHSRGARESKLSRMLGGLFREASKKGPLRIVTFNYDLIVEQALQDLEIDYRYSDFSSPRKLAGDEDLSRVVCIAKPHGSIHWVPDNVDRIFSEGVMKEKKYRTDSIWPPNASVLVDRKLVDPKRVLDVLAKQVPVWSWDMDVRFPQRTNRHENRFDLPAIIPPAAGKDYGLFQLAMLQDAYRYIAESSTVAVIGYSFPDADDTMRRICHAATRAAESKRVLCVNPDDTACNKAREIIQGCRVELRQANWELNDLEKLLH